MTRRQVLGGASSLALAMFLAGCGGGSGNPAATAAGAAGSARRGGLLRVGHVGAGKAETFNPGLGSSYIDASRFYNLYDPLTRVNPDLSLSPALALKWIPNKDASVWEIHLRPDVTWHDGTAFTADDVIFTMRSMGDPKHAAHSSVTDIRLAELKRVSNLVLRVPLARPNARLFDSFVQQQTVVIKNGTTDFSKPVGTGPFTFESFSPGQRSVCRRNPSYWEHGKPYVDQWEDISIDDDTARVNALLGGQIDMMSQLPLAQAKAHQSQGDIQVLNAESPSIQPILMAVDLSPFQDVRVRQAFRLIPDRQAMINDALFGFGSIGNDLTGHGLPFFASDLPPRQQDLEQAKSLLRQAGRENLSVTLHTSTAVPGFVEAATLFAEQAKGAGVNVQVKQEPANAYFDTSLLYTKLNFAQSSWIVSSIPLFYEQALLSDAVWNETHWRSQKYDEMIRVAQGTLDQGTAEQRWHDIQKLQYDQGGYIVWSNQNLVDGLSSKVRGLRASSFANLGGYNYRDLWLSA